MLTRIAAAVLLVVVPIGGAGADVKAKSDAKDSYKLDIAEIAHGHSNSVSGWLKHTITFHEGFTKKAFKNEGAVTLLFPEYDSTIDIELKDGDWRAPFRKDGDVVGHARVWRPDGKSFTVLISPEWLSDGMQSYRWFAQSFWAPTCNDTPQPQPGPDPQTSCPAYLDDSRRLTHHL